MPYADTLSGLQAAVQAGDQANRSSLENSLARLIQVSQFREGKQKEDALKERQFQFAQQQHADQLKQQALSNTRNAQLDDDAWMRWNAQLDSNELLKDSAATDKEAQFKQAEDDRRFGLVTKALERGEVVDPSQLDSYQLNPHYHQAATGILKGLASEAAARQATDQNAAAVANLPVVEADTARRNAVIAAGHRAQALQDDANNYWTGDANNPLAQSKHPLGALWPFSNPTLPPSPGTAPIPISAKAAMVAPRIDPRQVTIDATTGLAVPIYRSPYTIPVAQGAVLARPSAQTVDYGEQLMAEARDAIARGARPDLVRQRVQEALSRQ